MLYVSSVNGCVAYARGATSDMNATRIAATGRNRGFSAGAKILGLAFPERCSASATGAGLALDRVVEDFGGFSELLLVPERFDLREGVFADFTANGFFFAL